VLLPQLGDVGAGFEERRFDSEFAGIPQIENP
jgi:hypothetical protein